MIQKEDININNMELFDKYKKAKNQKIDVSMIVDSLEIFVDEK